MHYIKHYDNNSYHLVIYIHSTDLQAKFQCDFSFTTGTFKRDKRHNE